MQDKSQNNSALRAELRGNENSRILFINNPRLATQMHFILHSTKDGIKVYRQDNSWGDSCRSFTLVEENKKTFRTAFKGGHNTTQKMHPWCGR